MLDLFRFCNTAIVHGRTYRRLLAALRFVKMNSKEYVTEIRHFAGKKCQEKTVNLVRMDIVVIEVIDDTQIRLS